MARAIARAVTAAVARAVAAATTATATTRHTSAMASASTAWATCTPRSYQPSALELAWSAAVPVVDSVQIQEYCKVRSRLGKRLNRSL